MSETGSEKIFALLLRLYPAHFREEYGEEAARLFRDRARDEQGFWRRVRLWIDLLGDFAVSVPREYRYGRVAMTPAVASGPSFGLLEGERIRPEAVLMAGVLSIASLAVTSHVIVHVGDQPASTLGSGPANSSVPTPQSAAGTAGGGGVDAAERQRVIDGVVANLKEHYVDPEVARKTSEALLAHVKNGDDNVSGSKAFADLLTKQMRDASHDRNLEVAYSKQPIPERPAEPTAASRAQFRESMLQQHCMFEKVEVLPHNVGYIKLNFFPDVSVCGSAAVGAMNSVNNADAVIFDLRDNRGGFEEMVSLIASYLFDHPEYMYSPRRSPTRESWTQSPVAGSRLADKPVYILTSSRTFSGAEQFSYDLKMLKRATLVGETTGGGEHAGGFHRIDDHFGVGVTEVKAVNPYANAGWEGVGVEPDVKVKAGDALETAKRLAEGSVARTHSSHEAKAR